MISQMMSDHPRLPLPRSLLGQFSRISHYLLCCFLVIFYPLIPTLLLDYKFSPVRAMLKVAMSRLSLSLQILPSGTIPITTLLSPPFPPVKFSLLCLIVTLILYHYVQSTF